MIIKYAIIDMALQARFMVLVHLSKVAAAYNEEGIKEVKKRRD